MKNLPGIFHLSPFLYQPLTRAKIFTSKKMHYIFCPVIFWSRIFLKIIFVRKKYCPATTKKFVVKKRSVLFALKILEQYFFKIFFTQKNFGHHEKLN
jgi:hypothetical protein